MKKWLHDKLGWGFDAGVLETDSYGFQDVHSCRFCTGRLAQDSTGAWFHLTSPD